MIRWVIYCLSSSASIPRKPWARSIWRGRRRCADMGPSRLAQRRASNRRPQAQRWRFWGSKHSSKAGVICFCGTGCARFYSEIVCLLPGWVQRVFDRSQWRHCRRLRQLWRTHLGVTLATYIDFWPTLNCAAYTLNCIPLWQQTLPDFLPACRPFEFSCSYWATRCCFYREFESKQHLHKNCQWCRSICYSRLYALKATAQLRGNNYSTFIHAASCDLSIWILHSYFPLVIYLGSS